MKRNVFSLFIIIFYSTSFAQIKQEHLGYIHNGKVEIYKVSNKSGKLGHSLWINRTKNSNIKAKYFADKLNHNSIYNRYNIWKNNKTLISVCSGAFTNDYTKPIGITIDNGKIINRAVDKTMDGLVIVYATGGIVVSDLSEGNLNLQGYSKSFNIRNVLDKNTFLEFAQENNATVFQTQLLIYNNKLKIKNKDKNNQHRERRFLVIAKNQNEDILHIIFNIPEQVKLYDISSDILNYFKNSRISIIALLNLDTGNNDMMEVYENGKTISYFNGRENISKAINLIVYHIE
jgi:hypothetical protein